MLGNSEKMCSKYMAFYDSPVLFTLAHSTLTMQQGAAEHTIF
jgi:hypothetical protein